MSKSEKNAGVFRRIPAADVDLATDINSTILNQSPRGGRVIIWLTAIFFALFVYWAAVSEIEQVTRSSGKVIPSSHIQIVQNLEGGILSELLVDVGDIVERGQLLLEIDKTRFSAPYMESRVSYLALKAKIVRLEAETAGVDYVVPEEIATEKPEIGVRERELFESRKQELDTSLGILREQYTQRKQELLEHQSRLTELRRTFKLLSKELSITKPLVAKGAVSEVDVLRLERQESEMRGEIETTKLAIPKINSKITEAEQAIKEERIAFFNEARQELNDAYAKLEGLSATALALEDRLHRTAVRSPVRGTVNQMMVSTIGGIIQPGMDLVEIVPLEDTLLVEARIKPADIAFLRPDQEAMVKFTAYDFTIYGGLEANLEHISADSITDEHGNDFYLVRLRTQQNYLGNEDDPLPIIPGMVVSADILTGKKTILSYLLKPVLRAQKTALRER